MHGLWAACATYGGWAVVATRGVFNSKALVYSNRCLVVSLAAGLREPIPQRWCLGCCGISAFSIASIGLRCEASLARVMPVEFFIVVKKDMQHGNRYRHQ